MLERIPPQSIEAEQAVLGAMMIEKEAVISATEMLKAEDFYRESHRLIFKAIEILAYNNEAVDIITVVEQLKKDDKLEQSGGIAYVTSLANAVPTAANAFYHARIVEEKALLRNLITTATHITGLGYDANDEVGNLLDQAEKMILGVSTRKRGADFLPIRHIVTKALEKIEQLYQSKGGITGVASGFRSLDRLTSGFQASDLILIAARPSSTASRRLP